MEDAAGALRFLKKYGLTFLTWLLCAVSMSEVLYIYTGSPVNVYSLISAAAAAGLIKLFDFLRTKKFGGFVYFGLLVTVSVISALFVGGDWESIAAFVKWFFSGAQAEDTRISFMLALTPFMLFFLTSAFYYFTKIIYRTPMLALVSLIPFALSVKTAAVLPAAYAFIIAPVNLILCIIDGRKKLIGGKFSAGGNAAVVYTDFAAAAVLLALVLPKPSETPYYDKFEAAVNMFSFGGSGETVYRGEYKTESGNADDLLRGENVLIYIVSTSDPVYMKAQVFDLYDSGTGRWISMGESVRGSKSWQERAPLLNYERLAGAVRTVSEKDPELMEDFPFAENIFSVSERESFSIVYSRDYASQYVLSPLRATGVSLSSLLGIEWCARSDAGEIFTNLNRAMLPPNADYTVRYYTEETLDELIQSGYCDADFEDYRDFLNRLYAELESGSEEEAVVGEFLRELWNAEDYNKETETQVSPEIRALAEEITEGLRYDYEKAYAIEQYFHTGEFVYNLAYEPPVDNDTPEYFLFQSKTGICSDFASAYTLLARAAGLTVRYAEGFVPVQSKDSPGTYYIYTDNAHAYPETYIPGAGWVIYEPTPPNLLGGGGEQDRDRARIDYTAVFLTAIVFVCGFGAFIFLVIITPRLLECIFRIRTKYIGADSGSRAVVMLYNRHVKNAESRLGINMQAFTPEQTAAATENTTGLSLVPLTEPFIKACYGGGEIDASVFKKAYECYKAQAKAMRKRNKKRRNST